MFLLLKGRSTQHVPCPGPKHIVYGPMSTWKCMLNYIYAYIITYGHKSHDVNMNGCLHDRRKRDALKQQHCILPPEVPLSGEFAKDHPLTTRHSDLVGKIQEKDCDGNQETRSCCSMGTSPDQSDKMKQQLRSWIITHH
jgi:hypothetical protein